MAYFYRLTFFILSFVSLNAFADCVLPPLPENNVYNTFAWAGPAVWRAPYLERSYTVTHYLGTVHTQGYAVMCSAPPPPESDANACDQFKGKQDETTVPGKNPLSRNACITEVGKGQPGGSASGANCSGKFSPQVIAQNKNTGKWETWGVVTYSGESCTPTPSTPPTPDNPTPVPPDNPTPTPCKGQSGTVNNVPVCIPFGPDATKVQNTDKTSTSTTTTPNPSDPNAPPSTSETTTTKSTNTQCDGSKCTTTTTTSTSSPTGPPTTKTETSEQDKKSFCDENPNLSICKETSFNGNCNALPTCEGDAIQCAMAADQIARNCKMFDDHSTSEEALFNSEKNKEGSVTGDLPGNEAVSIGPGNFDTTDAIGSGAGCVTDKVVTIVGQSVTVPFSRVCEYLAMFGNALMLFSFVLAGRIVGRG